MIYLKDKLIEAVKFCKLKKTFQLVDQNFKKARGLFKYLT